MCILFSFRFSPTLRKKDPSIQAATRNSTNPQQTLDDYDPFSNESQQQRTQNNFGQPATLQPSSQTVPAYSPSAAQYNNNGAAGASSPAAMTQISTAELQVSVLWEDGCQYCLLLIC